MPLPPRDELLALMDANWRDMCCACARATVGGWVVERDGLLLCGSPSGCMTTNMAIVTGPVVPASVREETNRHFRAAGLPFTVWTRAHADATLEPALADEGFFEVHREPGMVLARDAARAPRPPARLVVRPVRDESGRESYGRIVAEAFAVYGVPRQSTRSHFASMESVVGQDTQAFLAYRDGEAVAAATLYLSHGVGGIAWVATLPEAGGCGYGAAVTQAVVDEGFRRGARFMSLQASPMGEPMYRRMGFATPTHYALFAPAD
jgi:hypothetical protein